MLCDLEVVINGVVMEDVEDSWEWVLNVEEGFKVKSLFIHLQSTLLPQNLVSQSAKFACKNVWRSAVPSKVSAFAWQLLLDRVPTKDNLVKRGLMHGGEDMCSLCGLDVETTRHLFLHCRFAAAVWYALNRWLGVVVVSPGDVLTSYGMLVGSGMNKKIRKGYSSVWLAYVWVIWKSRNDRIFNIVVVSVDDMVDSIQRISWQWFLNKVAVNSCLLYEWVWDPGDCMMR
jgi:hypothetical protein